MGHVICCDDGRLPVCGRRCGDVGQVSHVSVIRLGRVVRLPPARSSISKPIS